MAITILLLTIFLLASHRFILIFREQGNLYHRHGFDLYSCLFMLLILINSIYWFSWQIGIVLFLLVLFQFVFYIFIRPILFLFLILYSSRYKNQNKQVMPFDERGQLVLGLFSLGIVALFLLTVINFFVSDFKEGLYFIEDVDKNFIAILIIIFYILGEIMTRTLKSKVH